jgi:uncharacterized sporulation protein YeaH/YhbH (DUF444 family)
VARPFTPSPSCRAELMAELDALKAKFRRIPYIDPIDIRYRRF